MVQNRSPLMPGNDGTQQASHPALHPRNPCAARRHVTHQARRTRRPHRTKQTINVLIPGLIERGATDIVEMPISVIVP